MERLKQLSKDRNREKAKQRMSQIGGGDFSRGFGTKESAREQGATANYKPKNLSTKKPSAQSPKDDDALKEKKVTKKNEEPARLGKIVVDNSAINTMTSANTDTKRRRKKLIITILIISIVLIWTFIILTKIIKPQKPKHNCHLYLSGDAKSNCVMLLDGEENSAWQTPTGISPQSTYNDFKVEVSLPDNGNYNIRFRVEVYNKNTLVSNFGSVNTLGEYAIKLDSDGKVWREYKGVSGGQNVLIMSGITFYDVQTSPQLVGLSSSSIKINIYIEVNKA